MTRARYSRAYFDESGNTGLNFLDDSQPFFALGALVVKAEKEERLVQFLEKEKVRRKIDEFKASKLLKSHRGRRTALYLLKELGQYAIPVYSVHEKRFTLGARMVDELLDFVHNPGAPERVFRDKELRRETASVIAALPSETLRLANEYVRAPTAMSQQACVTALVRALREKGQHELAQWIGMNPPDVWEHTASSPPEMMSSNVATFATLSQMLEQIAKSDGRKLRLVHDEQLEFAQHIRSMQEMGRDPAVIAAVAGIATTEGPRFGLLEISDDVIFADSREAAVLQAADLIAGIATSSLRKIQLGKGWSDDADAELAFLGLGAALLDPTASSVLSNLVISTALSERLHPELVGAWKRTLHNQ